MICIHTPVTLVSINLTIVITTGESKRKKSKAVNLALLILRLAKSVQSLGKSIYLREQFT